MTVSFWAEYIDTCFSDYLQDGHNRAGEWLLCIPLGEQTTDEAVDEFEDMMNGEAPPEDFPDDADDAAIREALRDVCKDIDFTDEFADEREQDDDPPYVYVVLHWENT